jgi:hypothetical protein
VLRSLSHAALLFAMVVGLKQWDAPLAVHAGAFVAAAVATAFATGLLRMADLREALVFKAERGS